MTVTVNGFTFSKPVSLDPSTAMENGSDFMVLTKDDLKYGAREPLTMQVVFILADAYIALGYYTITKNIPNQRTQVVSNSKMLCCTSRLATFPSALVTLTFSMWTGGLEGQFLASLHSFHISLVLSRLSMTKNICFPLVSTRYSFCTECTAKAM